MWYAAKVEVAQSDWEVVVFCYALSEEEARERLTARGYFVYEVWEEDEDEEVLAMSDHDNQCELMGDHDATDCTCCCSERREIERLREERDGLDKSALAFLATENLAAAQAALARENDRLTYDRAMSDVGKRLVWWAQNEEMVDSGYTRHGLDCLEADAEIERLRAEVVDVTRELGKARREIEELNRLLLSVPDA